MLFVKLIQFLPLPCKKCVAYMCTCKVIVNKKFPIVIFTHTHTHTHRVFDLKYIYTCLTVGHVKMFKNHYPRPKFQENREESVLFCFVFPHH